MTRSHNLFLFLVITACGMQLAACHAKQKTNKQVFHYNETTGIASLDPAFAKNQSILWAVNQLYNGLVETDSNLHIVPCLAKSWDVSVDRLQYIFHLRTDVFLSR
jgi:peptide/nickel transport system substrate-binding protein